MVAPRSPSMLRHDLSSLALRLPVAGALLIGLAACGDGSDACLGQVGCPCAAEQTCLGEAVCVAEICWDPESGSGTLDAGSDDGGPANDDADSDPGSPSVPTCVGLSSTPSTWSVPHSTVSDLAGASALGSFVLLDLHGDGLADLVVTHPPTNGPIEAFVDDGGSHWWVYRNNGVGFEDAPQRWSVPHRSVADTAGDHAIGFGTLLDLQGDGRPDLVYTSAPLLEEERAFGDPEQPYWQVYGNDGSGFASEPEPWSVPHPTFGAIAGMAATGRYGLLDLRGRGRPDLVLTHPPPADAEATFGGGAPHWLIHENTGTGFAGSTMSWSVPHRTITLPFGVSALGVGAVLSLQGDRAADLVFTQPPNSDQAYSQGAGHAWFIYANAGSGFAEKGVPWTVPHRTVAELAGSTALGATSVLDLRGEGRPQLVVTRPPSSTRAFADPPHWLVYDSDESGFVEPPESFAVPHETVADLSGSSALGEHVLMSLDGQRCPALIVTRPPNSDTAFGASDNPHWLVYVPLLESP